MSDISDITNRIDSFLTPVDNTLDTPQSPIDDDRGDISQITNRIDSAINIPPPINERSPLMDIPTAAIAGTADLVEMVARAYRRGDISDSETINQAEENDPLNKVANWIIQNKDTLEKTHPYIFAPAEGAGPVRETIRKGFRAVIPSVGSSVPTAIAGLLIGGPVGAITGYIGGGATIFGLAEYDQFIEDVQKHNEKNPDKYIPPEIYQNEAVKSAIFEGGLEAANDTIEALTFKVGGLITKPVKESIKEILGQGWKGGTKQYLKNQLKLQPAEISTEIAQNYLETDLRKNLGLDNQDPLDAALSAIGPTFVSTLIMSTGAHIVNVRQNSKIANALTDPSTDFDKRFDAMKTVYSELQKKDKIDGTNFANTWGQVAQYQLINKQPIDITSPISETKPLDKILEAKKVEEQLNTDVAKFDERGKPITEDIPANIPQDEIDKQASAKTIVPTGHTLETRDIIYQGFIAKGFGVARANELASRIMGSREVPAPVTKLIDTGILDENGKSVQKEVPLDNTEGTIKLSPGQSILSKLPEALKNQFVLTQSNNLFTNPGSTKAILKKRGLSKEYSPFKLATGEWVGAPNHIIAMVDTVKGITSKTVPQVIIKPDIKTTEREEIPVNEYNNVQPDDLTYKGKPFTNRISANNAIARHQQTMGAPEGSHEVVKLGEKQYVARPKKLVRPVVKTETARDIINRRNPEYLEATKESPRKGLVKLDEIIQNLKDEGHEDTPAYRQTIQRRGIIERAIIKKEKAVKPAEVVKEESAPELMTPEEFDTAKAQRDKELGHGEAGDAHGFIGNNRRIIASPNERSPLRDALEAKKPVNAALFDRYNKDADHPLSLPEGYVLEGNRYVFKEDKQVEKKPAETKKEEVLPLKAKIEALKEKVKEKETEVKEKNLKDRLTARWVTARLKLGENVSDELVAKFKTVALRWTRNPETKKWEEHEPGYKHKMTEEERERKEDVRNVLKAETKDRIKKEQTSAKTTQAKTKVENITKSKLMTPLEETKTQLDNYTVIEPTMDQRMLRKMPPVNFPNAFRAMINHAIQVNDGTINFNMIEKFITQLEDASKSGKLSSSFDTNVDKQLFDKRLGLVKEHLAAARDYISKHQKEMAKKREQAILDRKVARSIELEELGQNPLIEEDNGPLARINVKHGTVYDFNDFDLDKIGTGEGAQAFGWGLYFTTKDAVAKWYAKSIARRISAPVEAYTQIVVNNLKIGDTIFNKLDFSGLGTLPGNLARAKSRGDSQTKIKKIIDRAIKNISKILPTKSFEENLTQDEFYGIPDDPFNSRQYTNNRPIEEDYLYKNHRTIYDKNLKESKKENQYYYDSFNWVKNKDNYRGETLIAKYKGFKVYLNVMVSKDNYRKYERIDVTFSPSQYGLKTYNFILHNPSNAYTNYIKNLSMDEYKQFGEGSYKKIIDNLIDKYYNRVDRAQKLINLIQKTSIDDIVIDADYTHYPGKPGKKVKRIVYSISLHEGKEPSEYDYIDRDKPLPKRQKEKIKAALARYGLDSGYHDVTLDGTGADMYQDLSAVLGSDKAASLWLNSVGFDGLTYKGNTSSVRNFIVFDTNAITIKEKTYFSRSTNPNATQTLSIPQVQVIINGFKNVWVNQPNTIIVKDRAELLTIADETLTDYIKKTPDRVRMGGVLHHDTIFLIADELINRDDIIKTMIHEMVGHYGVAKTLGPEFNEVCVNVFNKFKDTTLMKKLITDYDHYNPNERQGQQGLGAEFIAKMSEDKAYNPTFWEYLIQEVKRILNKIFGTEFQLPDNQIRALIMESNKFIEGKKDYGKVEDYFQAPVRGNQESPVPWAYSALLKGVQDNLKSMPAKVQSLRKWLEKFAKPEEIKWMGVEQFFGNKLIINKDEFLSFLKSNQIKLKEIHRGGERDEVYEGLEQDQIDELDEDDYEQQYQDEVTALQALVTEYETWTNSQTIPEAGSTLEEIGNGTAVQVPMPHLSADDLLIEYASVLTNDQIAWLDNFIQRWDNINTVEGQVKWASLQLPGGNNYREMQLIYNGKKLASEKDMVAQGGRPSDAYDAHYQSSHWSELNVLAHIRWNERTDDKGRKILFIEEIQSDWLQAAKHEGFIQTQGDVTAKGKGVSKAPFLENWDQLCMKRMIRYAAENGFDGIAWTTGEQQIQRYESALRKHVKEIKWTTLTLQEYDEGTPGKLKAVKVIEHNGNENTLKVNSDGIISSGFRGTEGHNIAEVVGKELAIKIMSKGTGSISGLDIKIGGKGMKVAYDERLPNFIKKYVKQWNAKLEKINLGEQDETIKEWRWETMDDGEYSLMTEDELFRIERDRNKVHYSLFVGEIGTNDEIHIGNFRTLTEAKDKALAYYNHEHNISNKPLKLKLNQPGFMFTPEMKHGVIYKGQPLWNKSSIDTKSILDNIEKAFDTTNGFVYGAGVLLPTGKSLKAPGNMHDNLIFDIKKAFPELQSKDMGTVLKLLKSIRTRMFGQNELYAEIPYGLKPTEAQYNTIERALNKETGSLTYDIVNESNQTIMSSGVVNTIDEFKRIFTGQGMSDVARWHKMGDVFGRRTNKVSQRVKDFLATGTLHENTPIIAYHGTDENNNFTSFDNQFLGTNTEAEDTVGHWFTPNKSYAEMYARNDEGWGKERTNEGQIYKVTINSAKLLDLELTAENTEGIPYFEEQQFDEEFKDVLQYAKDKGYDGLYFNDYSINPNGETGPAIIIFNPSVITVSNKAQTSEAMSNPQFRRIVDFQDATPETTKQELKDLFSDEAFAVLKSLSMQLPKNLPSLSWAERYLLSPEFYSHPTMEKIVKAAIGRHDRYYEIFNELNNINSPVNGEDNIIDLNIQLKHKGLTKIQILKNESSEDYKKFEKMKDEIDTGEWHKNYGDEDKTTWEQHYRTQGVSNDVIELYKLHRAAYDKALDLLITPMQKLITDIDTSAQREGTKPKYPTFTTLNEEGKPIQISLKEVIDRMGQLRGSYAPRIREVGDYVIKGKRFEKVVRYHKSNRIEAELLKKELERKGYKIEEIHEREHLPEDVYASLRIINTQKAIETAMKSMHYKELDIELLAKFNEELIRNVADLVRMRGFRSSMITRGTGEVVRGYITDPNERFVRYINNISAGIAKGEAAKKMFGLIAGEYEGEGKDRKKVGGIDPSVEHRVYDVATKYITEQLRNTDTADRIIGMVKSVATFKYLGFNPRSPVVNVLALVTTVPMAIHTHGLDGKGSMIMIGKELAKASKDYVNVMANKKLPDKHEQAYMDEIKKKGYDTPQYTREALGTIQKFSGKAWTKTMYWSMYIFGKSEQWIRGTTMLAAYRMTKAKNPGMTEVDLMDKAHFISNRAHGVYGKATQLAVGQGTGPGARLAQILYTYQKFGHTYIQALYEAGVRKGNLKGFFYGLMSPVILAGVAVLPFKDFWWKLIGTVLSIFGIKDDPEKGFWDYIRKTFGKGVERTGRHGIMGAVNLDVSSSMSIGVGAPRNFYEVLGIAGGLANDYMLAKQFLEIGQPLRATEKILPTGIGNFVRALRELNGVTTTSGARVWDENGQPYVPSVGETTARLAGFRSAKLATMGERTWETKREIKDYSVEHNSILEAYRNYLVTKGSSEDMKIIMDRVVKYNQSVIKSGKVNEVPLIKLETFKRQAKALSKPSKSMQAGMFQQ